MSPQDRQVKLLDLRRTVRRAADSVEGDAVLALIDTDISAADGKLRSASDFPEVCRLQGELRALERFRKYLTEDPIADRINRSTN